MLLSLGTIFLLGILLAAIAKRLALPPLIGMLVTGLILGPFGLNLLAPEFLSPTTAGELRTLALVVILLRAGLALSLTDLRAIGRPAVLLCFVPATCEIVATAILAPLCFDISTTDAILLGSVLAAVSPAVVVPRMLALIEANRGTAHKVPQLIMAGASVDDIFVIIVFTCFLGMAGGGTAGAPAGLDWFAVAQVPVGIAVGFFLGYGMSILFKTIHMRDSVKVLLLLGVSFVAKPLFGLLPIICMGMGLLAHRSEVARRLSGKFNRVWVVAELMLFVLVGTVVDPSYVLQMGPRIILLIAGVLLCRMVGVWCSLIATPLTRFERLFCMVAYLPKATVQAAIGAVPLGLGLPCGELILTVAVASIVLTAPLGAWAIDRLSKHLSD